MKKKYLLLWAPVAAMAFSSCSSEEEGFTPSATNEIRVVTEVNSYSRAGYTTENLDAFGLIIGSDSESFSYHKQMVKNGAVWTAADGQSMYWEDRGKAVDVIAYAPYRTDEINAKSKIEVDVQPDQSTEDGVKASDFVAMKKGRFVPNSGLNAEGNLVVAMAHMMAKVYVNIQYPEAYDQAEGANPFGPITVDGLNVNATLDLAAWDGTRENGSLAIDANGEAATIKPYATAFDASARKATYEFIAVPQTANLDLKFVIADVPYSWSATNLELKSGYSVTIDLKIDKTGVTTDDNVTVDPWEEGGSISGTPEQGADPFTVKEMTNKGDWQWVYSSQSNNFWGGDRGALNLWNGVGDELPNCWLSHQIVKGPAMGADYVVPFEGRYLEAFAVVDLGKAEWIAGIGARTCGYGDTTFDRVEFFATDSENIDNSTLSDDDKNNLRCSSAFDGDINGIKTVMDKVFAIDDQVTWTKIGEVSSEGNFAGWIDYRKDFSEDELADSPVKSRYVKVVFHPYTSWPEGQPYCERVSCAEIYLKHVTATNGVPVE